MNKLFILILLTFYSELCFSQDKLIHEVYFDIDKYDIPPKEEKRLLVFISNLMELDIESISIYGFCDDTGADTYNLKLSKRRANTIKSIFSEHNVNENLITNIDGKGEILLKIVNEKNILKIRGSNRKVEIIVKPKPIKIEEEKPILETPKKKNVTELIKGKLEVGDKITFENILFNTGYATVTNDSKKILENIAKALEERNNIYFTIQGHVCCTKYSRDAVNKKTHKRNLSQDRAKYIYDYFAEKGIDKKRMRYVGLRRKFPLGGDPKLDRRVEILITYVDSIN